MVCTAPLVRYALRSRAFKILGGTVPTIPCSARSQQPIGGIKNIHKYRLRLISAFASLRWCTEPALLVMVMERDSWHREVMHKVMTVILWRPLHTKKGRVACDTSQVSHCPHQTRPAVAECRTLPHSQSRSMRLIQ